MFRADSRVVPKLHASKNQVCEAILCHWRCRDGDRRRITGCRDRDGPGRSGSAAVCRRPELRERRTGWRAGHRPGRGCAGRARRRRRVRPRCGRGRRQRRRWRVRPRCRRQRRRRRRRSVRPRRHRECRTGSRKLLRAQLLRQRWIVRCARSARCRYDSENGSRRSAVGVHFPCSVIVSSPFRDTNSRSLGQRRTNSQPRLSRRVHCRANALLSLEER
jgi:hypothetical protein